MELVRNYVIAIGLHSNQYNCMLCVQPTIFDFLCQQLMSSLNSRLSQASKAAKNIRDFNAVVQFFNNPGYEGALWDYVFCFIYPIYSTYSTNGKHASIEMNELDAEK